VAFGHTTTRTNKKTKTNKTLKIRPHPRNKFVGYAD
jgi:hypothetical protein